MSRYFTRFGSAAVLLAVLALAGCGPEKKPTAKPGGTDEHAGHDHEGHDHAGHDHSHAHGPNGGHVVELDSADKKGEDYHAEWLHDDETGKLTVLILDKDIKNEVGIDAEKLFIDIKTADATETTELPAANLTSGDKPTATRFEVTDQKLVTILAGEGIDAKIRVSIDGVEFSGKIEHHKH